MIFLRELVKNNIITESEVPEIVKNAEEKYNGNIDQALLDIKVDEAKVFSLKGQFFNIPTRDVDPKSVSPSVLKMITVDAAKMYGFVAFGITDSVIDVGIVDPENVQAMDALTFITSKINKPFKVYAIKASVYNALIAMYEGLGNEVDQALSELDTEIAGTDDAGVTVETNTKTSDTLKPGEELRLDTLRFLLVAPTLETQGGGVKATPAKSMRFNQDKTSDTESKKSPWMLGLVVLLVVSACVVALYFSGAF